MCDSPIFVVGAPRSGTTLTAQILGKHSRVFMPREADFMNLVYAQCKGHGAPAANTATADLVLRQIRKLYAPNSDERRLVNRLFDETDLSSRLRSAADYRTVYSVFMEAQMASAGKERWGNNVPRDLFELDDLLTLFPKARIIVCVRNVFDFLVSYRDKWKKPQKWATPNGAERLKKIYHPVVTSLLWLGSANAARKALARWPDQVHLCRYEDLVAQPERKARELCEFVGEPFETTVLDIRTNNSSRTVAEQQQVFTSSIGAWHSRLSQAEAFVAQVLCGKELRRLGYSYEKLRPRLGEALSYFVGFPYFLARAVIATNISRGPLIPYLVKRAVAVVKG